jgi:hypothetical protein
MAVVVISAPQNISQGVLRKFIAHPEKPRKRYLHVSTIAMTDFL